MVIGLWFLLENIDRSAIIRRLKPLLHKQSPPSRTEVKISVGWVERSETQRLPFDSGLHSLLTDSIR
jgi:hypothetical protein